MTRKKGVSVRRLALTAGGTGGHMFPAEALGHEMWRRGWNITLFTDYRGKRFAEKFPADKIVELPASNPNRAGGLARVGSALTLLRGILMACGSLLCRRPCIVVGFGGYPSVPAMLAARVLRIPSGLHEQNAVLGRANRLSARRAVFVAHGFKTLRKTPKALQAGLVFTGNPVRPSIYEKRNAVYIPSTGNDPIHLLITGGSQGARLFSDVVPAALSLLPPALSRRLSVVHQVGKKEQSRAREIYTQAGIKVTMASFFDDMPDQLARAHLVIARAGASSVTEIAMVGRPSVLIPLAIAMDDHQTGNAEVLVSAAAAAMLQEEVLDPLKLADLLNTLLSDPARLGGMAGRAAQAVPHDAAQKLADMLEASVIADMVGA